MKTKRPVFIFFPLLITITVISCDIADYPYYLKDDGIHVHFSGDVISGKKDDGFSYPFEDDQYSDIIDKGEYNSVAEACPKAVASTFDSIALDKNTEVTIYSNADYSGDILFSGKGPLVVINVLWQNDSNYYFIIDEQWDEEMEKKFPPEKRIWSETNMHGWSSGSMRIKKK